MRKRTITLLAVVVAVSTAEAGTAASPKVIPWIDTRPVKASAHPALAAACTASALHAQLFLQGATGSLVGGVNLLNKSRAACSLLGWPTVSFAGAAATATRWQVKRLPRSQQPLDVLADPPGSLRALAPGKSATVTLWWSNWCGPGSVLTGSPGTPPDGLVFALAGGSKLVVPLIQAPRCDAPQEPSTVLVGPFVPTTRRLPASSQLPLHAAIIGPRPVQVKPNLHAFRARRGQLLHYRVALTNTGTRPFSFAGSSCPLYIEQIEPGPQRLYVLNCRFAGSIAARRTVVFAMQLRIPTHAPKQNSLTWELAPKTYQPPFATAAISVIP